MGPGEEEELQPSGCGEQTHGSGVPKIVGSDNVDIRQRRGVELEVRDC